MGHLDLELMIYRIFLPLLLLVSVPAHAVTFYIESQTGLSQFRNASSFFGTPVTSPTDLGFSFGMAFMASFGNGDSPMELQLGVLPKYSTGSDTSGSYTVLSLYPLLRLQLSRLYLAGGATPWIYHQSSATGGGFDQFPYTTSSLAYYGEAGFLFPLVPTFSIGFSSSATWINGPSGENSGPLLDFTFLMRFYAGSIGGSSSGHTSNEFRGWRYPFGHLR